MFFFSSRRRHTRSLCDWSSDVCSSDLYKDSPYDPLVDRYEPGMTSARLGTVFSQLREAIVPLVREIAAYESAADDSCLHQQFDRETQLAFALNVTRKFGYDTQRGRLDL